MWTMAERCIGIRFKQDISLVVYNVIAIRIAYRSCFDARNDEENYNFEVFLVPRQQDPEIKLFEPCFHQRVPRVGYEVYFIRFLLFPFHFIIPYCYFVHGIKMHFVLFFFSSIESNAVRKKKKKENRNPLSSNYWNEKFSSNISPR